MMNYLEYIEKLDSDSMKIHFEDEDILQKSVENPIMLFSHVLTRSGAPTQLMYLTKALIELGYQPFMYSIWNGDLLEELLSLGVVVIEGMGNEIEDEWLERVSKLFDYVFTNTILMYPIAENLAQKGTNTFCWIHEGAVLFKNSYEKLIGGSENLRLLAASPKISRDIYKYIEREAEFLEVCVDDYGDNYQVGRGKTAFLWAGSLDVNKALEYFMQAILELQHNYFDSTEYYIVGKTDTKNAYTDLLEKFEKSFPNIHAVEQLSHNELMELMDHVDSVVVTSIEETTSMIAVEGLMKGKIAICSSGCGVIEYLKDGEDAFIYPRGDYVMLSEKMKKVINAKDNLNDLRKAGRKVYEQHYTYECFKERVRDLLTSKR